MKEKINKIIDDTLKSPKGKWSRKSLTMFVAFIVAIFQGFYIVIKHEEYAVEVFFGFLAVSLGNSILALHDKIKDREKKVDEEITE